ncbi:MAG TPA: patatin-like phospholipase family protein [Burkholderiales bacterium]|nr:patatin-like phospholipase family protein [Burkholderiales bacterium]
MRSPHIRVVFLLLMLGGCTTLPTAPPPQIVQVPPKIALVLGGGGTRGFAHIGVIKALEASGIAPDIIVGTSAGSVVGALYAAGYGAADLERVALRMDSAMVADWSLPDRGFIKGQALQDFVDRMAQNRPLEKLNKPFAVVVTDLKTGERRVLQSGDTGVAVRASSSVPGVFQPVMIDGREYVDGGLTSPVPVGVARALGAGIVIAVDISGKPQFRKTGDSIDILLQTFSIMEQSIAGHELADADVVIRPEVGALGSADFDDRELAIGVGERAALAVIPLIRQKIADKTITTTAATAAAAPR